MGVFKGGVGIGTGDLNDLEVVVCGALGGRRIGAFEEVRCFLGGRLDLLIIVLGLSDTLLGDLTKCLRQTPFQRLARQP